MLVLLNLVHMLVVSQIYEQREASSYRRNWKS